MTMPRNNMFSRTSSSNAAVITTATPILDVKESMVDLSDIALSGTKVASVAHGMWRRVVRPGDVVIDATCGNGNDTLKLARMVCTAEALGYVYAFDIQEDALANSSYHLDRHLDPVLREQVKLLQLCHSRLEKIVSDKPIRLVTFNLGYLPGGYKNLITNFDTTIPALHAARNVLRSGGLVRVVAYIGHPGGRFVFVDFATGWRTLGNLERRISKGLRMLRFQNEDLLQFSEPALSFASSGPFN